MSKLTVAHLFDAVRSTQDAVDAFDVLAAPPQAASREAADRSPIAERSSCAPSGGARELAQALSRVFDLKRDRVVSACSELRRWPTAERAATRGENGNGRAIAAGDLRQGAARCREFVEGGLSLGLGLAQARELLAQQHWVVVVLDSAALAAALDSGELDAAVDLRRFLLIWVDEGPPRRAAAAWLAERLSSVAGLTQVGPLGGLEAEELAAAISKVKSLGQPTIVHLSLRPAPEAEWRRVEPNEAPPSGMLGLPAHAGKNGVGLNVPAPRTADAVHRIDPPHGVAASTSAVLAAAFRHARRAAQIVAVDLLSDTALLATAQPGAERRLRPPPRADVGWYEGLVAGGCRPLLLVNAEGASHLGPRLVQEACQRRLPMTIVALAGTIPSFEAGETAFDQRSTEPEWAWLPRDLPVMAPSTIADLDWMLDLAASQAGPVMMLVPRHLSEATRDVFAPPAATEFGHGQCVCEGADLAIIAWGAANHVARRVAFELARGGIEASVVNPVFLRPLDESLIARVARDARAAIVIEDPSLPSEWMLSVLHSLSAKGETLRFARMALDHQALAENADAFVTRAVERCRGVLASAAAGGAARTATSVQSLPSAQKERAAIHGCSLSADVLRWIEAYAAIGQRDLYLWRWARRGAELTTLPCVRPELLADVCDTKVLSIMVCVLLDDVADAHGRGEFLDLLIRVTCDRSSEDTSGLSAGERKCAELAHELTREYERRIRAYPHYGQYEELLRFDAGQFANTLRYSHLLNRNAAYLNLAEHDLYLPHNMHMMSFAMLDLMCTRDFPAQEVGKLRQAAWHGQCMGRIGNLLSTWRRELASKDVTSGVFARAVTDGQLTPAQIIADDPRRIESALQGGKHEYYFIRRWQHHRDCMEATLAQIRGVCLQRLLDGHDRFFQMHLASQGSI